MLLTKDTITAKQLADYFEVSVRTIYRDIELLSSLNVPIYMNKGKNGGISLLKDYKFDKTLLTEEDQNQILFALQSLEQLGGNNSNVFSKMKLLFNKSYKNWIDVDFTIWGKSAIQNEIFSTIKKATIDMKKIEFTYYNSYGEKNKRLVEPLQICFKYNAWYVFAYDELKKDYRLFKITRMKDLKILDENFMRNIPDREYYKEKKVKTIVITLEIDKEMSYRVYDEFEEDCVSIMKNGNYLVKVEYPVSDWIYGYILSFGEYAKVISPEEVKQVVKDKLEKCINNYL